VLRKIVFSNRNKEKKIELNTSATTENQGITVAEAAKYIVAKGIAEEGMMGNL
jgi:hypothetical protein